MDDVGTRYAETLDWLYRVEVSRGWDLKLESVHRALAVLGSPQTEYPALHVAGTNGKGSTSAIAHRVLECRGWRVGLFTSPHLSDFRERIRIGEEWISREAVVDLVAEIRARLEGQDVELTFFELTTVLAFLWFARSRVDAAVVEVGLGGRLDATNVLVPRATVVTTIAFDHERYLGSTLEEIAAEKAGIFKPGVPAVVGRVDEPASSVLSATARRTGSPLRRLGEEFRAEPDGDTFDYVGRRTIRGLVSGLRGRFQIDNATVALAALEDAGWLDGVSDEIVRDGVRTVSWPGRLERIGGKPEVLLDGAHNPAGVAALVAELPAIAAGRTIHLVFGVLADKRWPEMVERLAPFVADVSVVAVAERRSEDPREVAEVFRRHVTTRVEDSATEAVDRLLGGAASDDALVLVAGSLFLVGEVRAHLDRKRRR